MNTMIIPKAAALLAVLLVLSSGCGFTGGSNNPQQSPVVESNNTAPLTSLDTPASVPGDVSSTPATNSAIPAAPEQPTVTTPIPLPGDTLPEALIALDWQEVKQLPPAEAWTGIPADAMTVSVQRLKNLGGAAITFYTRPGDEDFVYADLRISSVHYRLGPAGTYNYRKPEDLGAAVVSLFNGKALKITGGLGANSTLSNYYTIDEAGVPTGMLRVDTGHTNEADVDRNGSAEVVSAHGTPMTAYVYRWHDGHAEEAYINDALQADSVVLRDDLIYEAADLGNPEVKEYQLTPEGLKLRNSY